MDIIKHNISKEIEFLDFVPRGKLKIPYFELYLFSQSCYKFFLQMQSKKCINFLIKIFLIIYDNGFFFFVSDDMIKKNVCLPKSFKNNRKKKKKIWQLSGGNYDEKKVFQYRSRKKNENSTI
ncbi:hypothetical protein A3Q56_04605 [Intoshia linei]|uniref:Uncharacterized protein n=1 Tax=Intoshia linei TaxID=1819745 RepID=A0A177B2J8_9BILA|nr:hypothetical protein A3Q56_04605 [Intoshia linei]